MDTVSCLVAACCWEGWEMDVNASMLSSWGDGNGPTLVVAMVTQL